MTIYQDLIIRNDIHDKIHNSEKIHENSDQPIKSSSKTKK